MITPPAPDPHDANGADSPDSADGQPKRRHPVHRAARVGGGLVLLVVGLITWPMPIPVGLLLIALGLVLLAQDSHVARSAIRWTRTRLPALDRAMHRAAARVPGSVRAVIHLTTPDQGLAPDHNGNRGDAADTNDRDPARSPYAGGTAGQPAPESAPSSQG